MTIPNQVDEQFLRRALELARQGVGLTSPNPCVGAVIVDDSGPVGEGFHTYDGIKHAEVLALEQAGAKARGATLYVNLEPCSHQGRTGPCADAVIAAGIRRVVACMADPNPQVGGAGFSKLRAAGVAVESRLLMAEGQQINEAFAKYIRHRTPLVTLKSAMTLDGKIAPAPGHSANPDVRSPYRYWITGELARAHVQTLRHQHDAILVGVGTVLADDPLLTDRSGLPRRRVLLRVILDSYLRLPLDSQVVKTCNGDVMVFCSSGDAGKKKTLEDRGVRVEEVPGHEGRPDLSVVLRRLGELEITSLMIEGGAMVNGAALASGLADKVFLYYAPKVMGEEGAVSFVAGPGYRSLGRAGQVKGLKLHRFGEDFAVEGYLKDPYA